MPSLVYTTGCCHMHGADSRNTPDTGLCPGGTPLPSSTQTQPLGFQRDVWAPLGLESGSWQEPEVHCPLVTVGDTAYQRGRCPAKVTQRESGLFLVGVGLIYHLPFRLSLWPPPRPPCFHGSLSLPSKYPLASHHASGTVLVGEPLVTAKGQGPGTE